MSGSGNSNDAQPMTFVDYLVALFCWCVVVFGFLGVIGFLVWLFN